MDTELIALHGLGSEHHHPRPPRSAPLEVDAAATHLDTASATEVVRWAHGQFGSSLVLSSSFGADSAVMLHLVTRVVPRIPVILIDTGYLFPETYQFAERLRERFDLDLRVYGPRISTARQEALHGRLWEQGDDGVQRYLRIHKVEPMQRALSELGATAWIAGLRATQTTHRQALRKVASQDGRVKVHPILDWTREQVDSYLAEHDLPRHPLYDQGFRSIGDWHSTWPVAEDEDERAGRVLGVKQECGLHLTLEENQSLSSSGL